MFWEGSGIEDLNTAYLAIEYEHAYHRRDRTLISYVAIAGVSKFPSNISAG